MGDEERQGGGGHAPIRLPAPRCGAARGRGALSTRWRGREAPQSKVLGQDQILVAPQRGDVRRLCRSRIDGIFGVDLQLLRDSRQKYRPSPARCGRSRSYRCRDRRQSRTRCGRWPSRLIWSPKPIAALGVRVSARARARAASSAARFLGKGPRPPRPYEAERETERREALVGIVGAQRQAIFRREVNIGRAR